MTKIKFNDITDKIRFGKYKNKTIRQIMFYDITYCQWLFTLPNVQVSPTILQHLFLELEYRR